MAVKSTKFRIFFNLEKILVRKLENLEKQLNFLNVFYFYLRVYYIFKGKSEPAQWLAAAVAPDNKAWFK